MERRHHLNPVETETMKGSKTMVQYTVTDVYLGPRVDEYLYMVFGAQPSVGNEHQRESFYGPLIKAALQKICTNIQKYCIVVL